MGLHGSSVDEATASRRRPSLDLFDGEWKRLDLSEPSPKSNVETVQRRQSYAMTNKLCPPSHHGDFDG